MKSEILKGAFCKVPVQKTAFASLMLSRRIGIYFLLFNHWVRQSRWQKCRNIPGRTRGLLHHHMKQEYLDGYAYCIRSTLFGLRRRCYEIVENMIQLCAGRKAYDDQPTTSKKRNAETHHVALKVHIKDFKLSHSSTK